MHVYVIWPIKLRQFATLDTISLHWHSGSSTIKVLDTLPYWIIIIFVWYICTLEHAFRIFEREKNKFFRSRLFFQFQSNYTLASHFACPVKSPTCLPEWLKHIRTCYSGCCVNLSFFFSESAVFFSVSLWAKQINVKSATQKKKKKESI